MLCKHLPVEMPDRFPGKQFDYFMESSKEFLLRDKGDSWREFGGATNLIAWRFRACIEYFDAYRRSRLDGDADDGFEGIYNRERCWFGAFVSGISCIDSATYAIYALASDKLILGLQFGEREQRRCTPRMLAEVLRPFDRAVSVVGALDELLSSDDWALWVDLRNRMTHRSNLPRIIQASVGSAPPAPQPVEYGATSSTPHVVGGETWIEERCDWLSHHLTALLDSGSQLANGRFR